MLQTSILASALLVVVSFTAGCTGSEGAPGPAGAIGSTGAPGPSGSPGQVAAPTDAGAATPGPLVVRQADGKVVGYYHDSISNTGYIYGLVDLPEAGCTAVLDFKAPTGLATINDVVGSNLAASFAQANCTGAPYNGGPPPIPTWNLARVCFRLTDGRVVTYTQPLGRPESVTAASRLTSDGGCTSASGPLEGYAMHEVTLPTLALPVRIEPR